MYKLIKCSDYVKYEDGLKLQLDTFDRVKNREIEGALIILEHSPVFTIGTGGGWENLLCSRAELESGGIDIAEINRGGNITFHGPGQVVAYPIFNLNSLKCDAHGYIFTLEQLIINVLNEYGIEGFRKPEYKGVWIEDEKISAVGVHLKRWITTHGLSFNVNVDKRYFAKINPCGIKEFGICSLSDKIENIDIAAVKQKIVIQFEQIFNIKFIE